MAKKYLELAAGLLLLAGCTNNDFSDQGAIVPDGQKRTITSFTATMEINADTRTLLLNGKNVVWAQNDRISVISDQGMKRDYEISAGIGQSTATFDGDPIEGNSFIGVYPPSVDNKNNSEKKQLLMPYYPEGFFKDDALGQTSRKIPMLAKSTDNNLHFKQLAGIFCFTLKGTLKVHSAKLSGNNGEQLPDLISVDYSGDEPVATPYFKTDKIYDKLDPIVVADEDIDLASVGGTTDVYFFLPAGMVFEKGITLTVQMYDNNYHAATVFKKTDKPITVEQGVSIDFAEFNLDEQLAANKQKQEAALAALKSALDGHYDEMVSSSSDGTNIKGLTIDAKGWEGEFVIPDEIAYLPLERLTIKNFTKLSSIDRIAKIKTLKELYLNSDNLQGGLPAAFGDLPELKTLNLNDNNFSGGIPEAWLYGLPNIKYIYINSNRLGGTVTLEQQQSPMWQRMLMLSPNFYEPFVYNQQETYGLVVIQANGLGTLTGLGIAKYSVRAEAVKSENGWILTFMNLKPDGVTEEADDIKAIDNLVVSINQGEVGDSVTVGSFPGIDFNAAINDANGNTIWTYAIEGAQSGGLLNIDHTDDGVYDVKLVMFVQSVSSLEIENVSFEWSGEIAIIPN